MNRQQWEEEAARLREQGLIAMNPEDWSPERALSILRENRRRYAHTPVGQAIDHWGEHLVEAIAQHTDVAPAEASAVLLFASSWLAGITVAHQLPAAMVTNVMGAAAEQIDKQANGGDRR
ncbi:hypothetical protein ACF1AX_31420 [Streptomyces sp. NPDC014802]|uniref:hypothetical protein n=1 Tax=Streptomyces sp. NPDC014802 TaxID=3364917 RepID=UPI0036FFFB0B